MRGGVKSPQGINIPVEDKFPRGGDPGVATKREGVPEEDGQGQGGDGNPSTTKTTEESRASGVDEVMVCIPGAAPPPSPQRGMAADDNIAGSQQRNFDGADGARPENGMHLRRKYGILASKDPESDPATAGPRVRGAGQGATRGWQTRNERTRR